MFWYGSTRLRQKQQGNEKIDELYNSGGHQKVAENLWKR